MVDSILAFLGQLVRNPNFQTTFALVVGTFLIPRMPEIEPYLDFAFKAFWIVIGTIFAANKLVVEPQVIKATGGLTLAQAANRRFTRTDTPVEQGLNQR